MHVALLIVHEQVHLSEQRVNLILQVHVALLIVHEQVHLSEQRVISSTLEPLNFDWDTTRYLLLYMWCNLACVTLLLVGSGIIGDLHQLPV